jgi:hypothetical protein
LIASFETRPRIGQTGAIERRQVDNALMAANVAIRLTYGVGGALAPATLARFRFGPPVDDRPDARLFVRGFSFHLLAVAALGVGGWRRPELRRKAAVAAVAIDVVDIASALAEALDRRRLDSELVGGIVFSAAGALSAGATLR